LRPHLFARETSILALSPDAKGWVIEGDNNTAKLITPTLPSGVAHEVWVPNALFSADGSEVVIWSTGGLVVLDTNSGRTLLSRQGPVCAARFVDHDMLVYHEASKEVDARLWRIGIRSGSATALGAERAAETCGASLDGRSWLVESYGVRSFVDGETGLARVLPKEADAAALSRAGNRWCLGDDAGFSCVRYPDERREDVWTRKSSDSVVFDITGDHAFIAYANDPDDVRDAFAFVDFAAQTIRPLEGVRATSGSLFDLGPEGKLLTIGSGSGLWVYDLERGVKRFGAHRPLYGNFSFPYLPRVLVAGTDEPMDLFLMGAR
jgi:hypothetical protein